MATAGAAKITLKITDRARFVWRNPTVASGTTFILVQTEGLAVADAMVPLFVAMLATVIAWWAWRCSGIKLGRSRRCADDKEAGRNDQRLHGTRFPKYEF
jgi:hypothetical protein